MKSKFYGSSAWILAMALMTTAILTSTAQRGPRGGFGGGAPFTSKFVPMDEKETKILGVMEELMANEQYRNVPPQDGQVLRVLAQSIHAQHIVEIGTSTGYSGLWFAMALQKTGGKMTTYEIDKGRADTAKANFKAAGVENIITVVLGDAHEEVKKLDGTIDLLFLDADKEGYIDYLNTLMPKVRSGGLIVAHNINAGMADPNFIQAISDKAELETLYMQGMSITMKK